VSTLSQFDVTSVCPAPLRTRVVVILQASASVIPPEVVAKLKTPLPFV